MNKIITHFPVAKRDISYEMTPDQIKTFADPSKPFLTFDQFVNIVQWFRDAYYAPDHVEDFNTDIGKDYLVWTKFSTSSYFRHVFPDQLSSSLRITFDIPHLNHASWFPLVVKLEDDDGLYFHHEQQLVVERAVKGRFVLSSWRRVPKLARFLKSQLQKW